MSVDITGTHAVDLFAGPGGWDVAARRLGMYVVGIEFDAAACATRRANGLPTIEGDIRNFGPNTVWSEGLIASPPCQTFSQAGNGAGRRALDTVLAELDSVALGYPILYSAFDDERTGLVLEPMRWIVEAWRLGRPYEWIALEQVPTVQPVWDAYAEHLRDMGYFVDTAVLSAEQYGVPQTRKRAILQAKFLRPAPLPEPTHSKYYPRTPEKLDPGVKPWISMAEALRWGFHGRPAPTVSGGGTETGGAEPFANARLRAALRAAR